MNEEPKKRKPRRNLLNEEQQKTRLLWGTLAGVSFALRDREGFDNLVKMVDDVLEETK